MDRQSEDARSAPQRARRRGRAGIASALFVAAFAYLYAFRNEGIFHLDAVFLAQAVEDIYARGHWDRSWRFGAVLANALVYLPFWLSGENAERATVLASILFHAASIAMAFLFLDRLSGSRRLAALAAGLFAVTPIYAIPNTFGKEYGLAVLLIATSFCLALAARRSASAMRAASAALVLALSFVAWEGALAITPIFAVVLLAPRCERPVFGALGRRLATGALVGFGVGLAFDLSTSLHSILRTYAGSPHMTGFLGLASPMLPRTLHDLVHFLGWPLLTASGFGLVLALARRRYRSLLPLATLMIATVAFYGNLSTYGPRYLVLVAFGVCILAGVAFHVLLGGGPVARVAAAVAFACVVGSQVALSLPLLAPRHAYNGAKQCALMIAAVTEPGSVIITMDDRRFVEYYARRATLQHPIGDRAATDAWIDVVRQALNRGPVYLTESGLSYDPRRLVRRALRANFAFTLAGKRVCEDYHHAERRLQRYQGHLWRLTPR